MFDLWKLKDFAPGEGVGLGAFTEQYATSDWLDIPVPGDVHQALIGAGRIPDPFYDRNEMECAWMEEREWWYRLNFQGPSQPVVEDERLLLVFQGLDTFATIWLNGEELGKHSNMFSEAIFDVSQRIRSGQTNTLALCFDRPLDHLEGELVVKNWGSQPQRVAMRKAQYSFGWDWGPRLPTIGIWRPVELRRQRCATLQGVHFSTIELDQAHDRALVSVRVDVDAFATSGPLLATIELSEDEKVVTQQKIDLHDSGTAYLLIEHPRLWWTHDLGEPALYTLRVVLSQDGVELDQQQQQVGIRTIELDQSLDMQERGTRFFRFVLNGIPIFARGANWIPAHSFVGSITEERYQKMLVAARDANMNMLRVWGGGIYEHDIFYELCNQLGILIWQDFMFSCAMYPEEPPAFVDEVEAEARYQVQRLRNHPCLALWCGNNENQWIHDQGYWDQPEYMVPGALYYDTILPQAVKDFDGKTPYWPGSPYGGNDYNSMEDGDRHNWQVWHGGLPRRFGEEYVADQTPEGVSYKHYGEDLGRFISEFGMHASPVYETLRRVIPEDQRYHHSPSMDHHNKDTPKNKGDNLMLTVTGLPNTLEEYINYSMIAQAEGLKYGIEHYRRRKPHCSGTLFWQLNDCWPVLSWSVMDYYGFGKAGYFYAKRVYSPVLASFKELADGGIELWLTNDTLHDLEEHVTVCLSSFDGQSHFSESRLVHVAANSSQIVWRWEAGQIIEGSDRYLSVRAANGLFPTNRHFFVAIKDLKRKSVQPEITITAKNEHELHVHITAPAYVYFLHVTLPNEHTQFSDNYFDLEAGESRTIVITNLVTTIEPGMVSIGWL